VVIANQWRENTIQSGDETPGGWAPIVRFESAGGHSVTFTSDISNYPSPWLVPLILFGIGGVMALFGARLWGSTGT